MKPIYLVTVFSIWISTSTCAVPTRFTHPTQGASLDVGGTYTLDWTPYFSQDQFNHISLPSANSSDYSQDFAGVIFESGFMQNAYGIIFLGATDQSQFNLTEIGKVYMNTVSFEWTVPDSVEPGDSYVLVILFGGPDQREVFSAAESNKFVVKGLVEEPSKDTNNTSPASPPTSASVSKGALIGGVVGGVVGAVILMVGAFFLGKWWVRSNQRKMSETSGGEEGHTSVAELEPKSQFQQVEETELPDSMNTLDAEGRFAGNSELDSGAIPSLHEMYSTPASAELEGSPSPSQGRQSSPMGSSSDVLLPVSPVSPGTLLSASGTG